MKKRQHSNTEDRGLRAVAEVVQDDFDWIWRLQPENDYGIDGQIEVVDEERKPTGLLLGVQVKSGESHFRGNQSLRHFYVDEDHFSYWRQHSLPVLLVLHNPSTKETLWQWVHDDTSRRTEKGWCIDIPGENTFDKTCKTEIEEKLGFDGSLWIRRRFALDYDLMAAFSEHEIFVRIEWRLNKTWRFKEIEILFDDREKEYADFSIPVVVTYPYTIADVMRHFLPWLSYWADEDPEEIGNEFEVHTMEAELSSAARAFLELEQFFRESWEGLDSEFAE